MVSFPDRRVGDHKGTNTIYLLPAPYSSSDPSLVHYPSSSCQISHPRPTTSFNRRKGLVICRDWSGPKRRTCNGVTWKEGQIGRRCDYLGPFKSWGLFEEPHPLIFSALSIQGLGWLGSNWRSGYSCGHVLRWKAPCVSPPRR